MEWFIRGLEENEEKKLTKWFRSGNKHRLDDDEKPHQTKGSHPISNNFLIL